MSPQGNTPRGPQKYLPLFHVRTPRRLFRGIAAPRKAALHAPRAPNPFHAAASARARTFVTLLAETSIHGRIGTPRLSMQTHPCRAPSPRAPIKSTAKTYPRGNASPLFPMREPRGACFGMSAAPRKATFHAHRAPNSFHAAVPSAARASIAFLAGSLHPRAHWHPSSFYTAAPIRARPSRAIPHARPYKTRRKNTSLRENIPHPRKYLPLFPCESPAALFRGVRRPRKAALHAPRAALFHAPAPPSSSLPEASIRGRTYTPRLSMRPHCPRPTIPRTRGNISPISHARAPRRLFRGIRRPRKAALHAHRAPPFSIRPRLSAARPSRAPAGRTAIPQRPYKTCRKNPSPRENTPRTRGNISPISHARAPRRLFRGIRHPPKSGPPCAPRTVLFHTAALSAARTFVTLLAEASIRGTLTPLVFLYVRARPSRTIPRAPL